MSYGTELRQADAHVSPLEIDDLKLFKAENVTSTLLM